MRFGSRSLPPRLRNCLWCTSRLDIVPQHWHLQLSRRAGINYLQVVDNDLDAFNLGSVFGRSNPLSVAAGSTREGDYAITRVHLDLLRLHSTIGADPALRFTGELRIAPSTGTACRPKYQ